MFLYDAKNYYELNTVKKNPNRETFYSIDCNTLVTIKARDLSFTVLENSSIIDFECIYFSCYNWTEYNIKLNNCSAWMVH